MLITNYLLTEQMKSTNDGQIKMMWGGVGEQNSPLCTLTAVSPIFEVHGEINHTDLQK